MRRSVPSIRTGSLKSAALIAVFSILFAAVAGAQDFRAKLTVTVTDPSGMAVPAAAVNAINAMRLFIIFSPGSGAAAYIRPWATGDNAPPRIAAAATAPFRTAPARTRR